LTKPFADFCIALRKRVVSIILRERERGQNKEEKAQGEFTKKQDV
jgi:hypothetical protein